MEKSVPSADTVRNFHSRHLSISYRSAENKELVKRKGEKFGHCKTYEAALRMLEEKHPGIFNGPLRLWNMDETAVNADYRKKNKVFSPAESNHGGFRVSTIGSGGEAHNFCH